MLQTAIGTMQLPPGMQVTSIISGPHVKNSAHFAGRAVDISLPRNEAGYEFVIDAIDSGHFSRIGTIPELVKRLGPYAAEHGVEMFSDPGTGDHVHLEVPQ